MRYALRGPMMSQGHLMRGVFMILCIGMVLMVFFFGANTYSPKESGVIRIHFSEQGVNTNKYRVFVR